MSTHKRTSKQVAQPSSPSLDEVLRMRLRELREDQALTRDQLAAQFRSLGFETDHDRIAAIERGRARVGLAELIGFAKVLGVDWNDLLGLEGEWIALTPAWHVDSDHAGAVARLERRALAEHARTPEEMSPGHQERELRKTITRQADEDVARVLTDRLCREIGPEGVAAAAHRLWGRGFTEERDARAQERVPADGQIAPRQLQALRAHASRGLTDELAESMTRRRRRS